MIPIFRKGMELHREETCGQSRGKRGWDELRK